MYLFNIILIIGQKWIFAFGEGVRQISRLFDRFILIIFVYFGYLDFTPSFPQQILEDTNFYF